MDETPTDGTDPGAGSRALPTNPLRRQRSAAPGAPPPQRQLPPPPSPGAGWGAPPGWSPPPPPPPAEPLDHVDRALRALLAFTLFAAFPIAVTVMAAGAGGDGHRQATSEAVETFVRFDLVVGVVAAVVTYGLASIRTPSARAVLLGFAWAGSTMVGFLSGFLGVFAATSPTVGDH